MSKKEPFPIDVMDIRRRARSHVDKGAVTDSYGADLEMVIKLLNDALATEVVRALDAAPQLRVAVHSTFAHRVVPLVLEALGSLRRCVKIRDAHSDSIVAMLIDGAAVNGSARLVGWFGSVMRYAQSGYLYHYAFAMILGLASLLLWLIWRP